MLNQSISRTSKWIPPDAGGIHEFMRDELAGVDEAAVGKRLRITREAMGLQQNTAADRIGISNSALNNYEQGEHFPSIPNVVKISEAYRVSLDWLLAGNIRKLDFELVEKIEECRKAWRSGEKTPKPRASRKKHTARAA